MNNESKYNELFLELGRVLHEKNFQMFLDRSHIERLESKLEEAEKEIASLKLLSGNEQ